MHPAAVASQAPDRPAVIMARTGQVTTFAELDAASNRLANLLRERSDPSPATCWPSSPRTIPASSRSPGRRSAPGSTTRRSTRTSRRRRPRTSPTTAAPSIVVSTATLAPVAAAAFTPEATPERPGPPPARRIARRLGALRDRGRRATLDADRRRDGRRLPPLLLGHHRPPEGDQATAHAGAARPGSASRRAVPAGARPRSGRRVPVPRTAVPRGAAGVVDGRPTARRHRRGDGAVRPGRSARPDRAAPRDPRPVRADHVRPHAQAPGVAADRVRRVQPEGRRPRRGAVPGRREGGDDRVVGADHQRVLLGDRGHRRHVHHDARVADPPRLGRPGDAGCRPHPRRRRQRAAHR